jgi:Rieske Fe-S protein
MTLTESTPTDAHPSTRPHHPNGAHDCAGCLDRRQVLVRAGLATLGVAAAGVLAACSSGGSSGDGSGSGSGASAPAAGGALAQLADIPVGGAISAQDSDGNPILLTQPEAGTVVGLSAICTHQGCTVAPDDKDHQLLCPCHGSTYDLEGKNTGGPAPSPLPPFDVHVSNGAVLAGKA